MEKHFRIVPRGVGLVIGCCTFPTWNGYPGLFADLATGNAVVVKPHPAAILPLAITVQIAREVLAEAGFDPNVVTLVAHEAGDDVAQTLALRPEVRLIDFTGSTRQRRLARGATRGRRRCTPRRPGVNQIVVDSADDFKGVARNIAFSLSLYTGQMCTAPQNIYVPRGGIDTADGPPDVRRRSRRASPRACRSCSAIPARAVEILGAVRQRRRAAAARGGARARRGRARHAGDRASAVPGGAIRTPLIVQARRGRSRQVPRGVVRPDRVRDRDRVDTAESLAIAARRGQGARRADAVACTRPTTT